MFYSQMTHFIALFKYMSNRFSQVLLSILCKP